MMHPLVVLALAATPCIEVDGPRITAADIPLSAVVGSGKDFGFVPAFGARRILRIGDTDVCVVRRGRTLVKEEVAAALRKSLPDASDLELIEFEAGPVPAGQLVFALSGLHGQHWGGNVRSADHTSVPVQATVRVTTTLRVFVAARDLNPGEPITPDAITTREDRVPGIAGARDFAAAVVGNVAIQRIPAGTPIERRMIRPKPAVSAGDLVAVTVLASPASLRFEARASSTARVGDSILLRSPLNGSLIRAKVAGERSAVVEASR